MSTMTYENKQRQKYHDNALSRNEDLTKDNSNLKSKVLPAAAAHCRCLYLLSKVPLISYMYYRLIRLQCVI